MTHAKWIWHGRRWKKLSPIGTSPFKLETRLVPKDLLTVRQSHKDPDRRWCWIMMSRIDGDEIRLFPANSLRNQVLVEGEKCECLRVLGMQYPIRWWHRLQLVFECIQGKERRGWMLLKKKEKKVGWGVKGKWKQVKDLGWWGKKEEESKWVKLKRKWTVEEKDVIYASTNTQESGP